MVRGVRWLAAAVTAVQFLPAVSLTTSPPPASGLLVAAAFALLNLLPVRWRAARDRLWRVELAADALLALTLAWLFRHDPASPALAVLAVPVVEGAVRGRLVGAVAGWAVAAGGFGLARASAGVFDLPHLLLHQGVLAMVALACGLLADRLGRESERQRQARMEAARRAQLLATVAAAARELTTLDAEQVLAGIVDSAIELGFDCAEMCVLTPGGDHWRSVHPRGLPHSYSGSIQPLHAGLAGLVYASRGAVELDDYSSWDKALPSLRSGGMRAVFAAPVWSGREIAAVLTAGAYRAEPITASEREAVELLASQASRALENAHRYAERERLQQQLTHQAFHDSLTGLPNRALLRDRLAQSLGRARRESSSLAVVFVDLDGFKRVNDRFGHLIGDELLIAVAARLQLCVRPGDTVARFGGDEFTVLLERVERVDDAVAVARRALEAVAEPVVLADRHHVEIAASAGIAWAPPGDDMGDADRMLQQADRAMYVAKEGGKGVIEVYDVQADRRHREFLALDEQLRRALDARQVVLHYQPVLAAADGTVQAVEALARWRHPERGAVPPSVFVPLAERSGTIVQLGGLVLAEATRTVARLQGVRVAVNASVRQLAHPSFLDDVERCLVGSGLPPARLLVEVAEQALVDEDSPQLRAVLVALGNLGAQVAVDDFGRGYCSLRHLRELPVHEVKLHDSLVAAAPASREDRAIARWVIELAHTLGMRVTAEAVESREQLDCLRELGCDLVQGHLFHAAAPFDELAPLLAARGAPPRSAASGDAVQHPP